MNIDHELKIKMVYFREVLTGEKTFEIRLNDRAFVQGQVVRLREIDTETHAPVEFYTGRELTFRIGYVTTFQQKDGYVVFGLVPITQA